MTANVCLDECKGLFDWVVVGRIGRKINQLDTTTAEIQVCIKIGLLFFEHTEPRRGYTRLKNLMYATVIDDKNTAPGLDKGSSER